MTADDGDGSDPQTQGHPNRGKNHGVIPSYLGRLVEPVNLFTFALIVVGILQWKTIDRTDQTLKLQQRAWVTFIGANLSSFPKKDETVRFSLLYKNTGHEPAGDMNFLFDTQNIEPFDPRNVDLTDLKIPKNTMCDGLQPLSGRLVAAPTGESSANFISEDTAHGKTRVVVDERFLNGEHFYVIQGCAAYKTQDQIKHSSFCYILEREKNTLNIPNLPQPNASPPANQLPSAPPQLPEITSYGFVTCAAGFDAD